MDISSTTTQVSTAADTATSVQSQKVSAKGESSFKEEMTKVSDDKEAKTESKTESKNDLKAESKAELKKESASDENAFENQETAMKNENIDGELVKATFEQGRDKSFDLSQSPALSGEISFQYSDSQEIQSLNIQTQALIDANVKLSEVMYDAKTPVKVDYTTIQMDMNDAQFFTELVQDTDKTIQNVVNEITQNPNADVNEIQKNVKVSATLMTALSEAVKNKQSFRIDFDKDVSVIIKVDRDGAISARFIPGDGAVEQYLKQNISTLRQRFDEQELAYNELSYTGQQKRNKKNNENNKENGHE